MNRLDAQIGIARRRLTADLFLAAWGRALLAAASVLILYVVCRTFLAWRLPNELAFGLGLLGLTLAWALIVALRQRPDVLAVATEIDGRLRLNEKFSTALHVREEKDAFSQAAVLDAERTAGAADLRGSFKLHFPKHVIPSVILVLFAFGLAQFIEPRNLFASKTKQNTLPAKVSNEAERVMAKVEVEKAIARIDATPKAASDAKAVQNARAELAELLKRPDLTPDAAHRKTLAAMQELEKAAQQTLALQQHTADVKQNEELLSKLTPNEGEQGPVADAQRALAAGNFAGAAEKLKEAANAFEAMPPEQKEAAAKQMEQLAEKLKQAANDPKRDEKMQQQARQLGLNPQQAKELAQQAAKGDAKAQQQLQQQSQQAMKSLNNGQGPTPQQSAQAQQTLQQMQGQANSQQQAQQLQESTQRMALAMRQSAGVDPQQATSAKQGNSNQAQQAQQSQQANAAKPANANQPLQQAAQSAQQQLQQMQDQQQQSQQLQNAQQQASQAANQAQQALNKENGQQQGQGGQSGSTGQSGQTAGGSPGQGTPGGNQSQASLGSSSSFGNGHTESLATPKSNAKFESEKKVVRGNEDKNGRMLAGSLVKADAPKGESKAALKDAARAAEQEAADEVDSERISKQAQKAVREYFNGMGE